MKYYLLYVQKLNFQVCENWRKKGNYIAGCRVVYNKKQSFVRDKPFVKAPLFARGGNTREK